MHNRVHSFGVNRGCYKLCYFVSCISNNLLCHLNGQCEHNHVNQKQPSASHSYVHFPQSVAFCKHWVLPLSHTHHNFGYSLEGDIYPCSYIVAQFFSVLTLRELRALPGCHGSLCVHLLTFFYFMQMSSTACIILMGASYLSGYVNAWTFTCCSLNLSFCVANELNHPFCDYSPHSKLSCSHQFSFEVILAISSDSIIVVTVFIIVLSHVSIFMSILKMCSAEDCQKTFSTCISHFTAVMLFFETTTFIYVMLKSSYSKDQNKGMSELYTMVIPMLKILIYSLRKRC